MRFLIYASLVLSMMFAAPCMAQKHDNITLNLPQTVIAEAAQAILPLTIDAHSKSIQGDINIIQISNVAVSDQYLSCQVKLAGRNILLLTEIAGHEIKLKVGSVDINSTVDAQLRFDANKQILYIKPVIKNMGSKSSGSNSGPDIGQALTALLNGREFPVEIEKIDPLLARTGAKIVTVNMKVANITTRPGSLQLSLQPQIIATPVKQLAAKHPAPKK